VNINASEILNKHYYNNYIRSIIENDLKLRLTRDDKLKQRLDKDIKLIMTYIMKGVTQYINEHQPVIDDKAIIYMVDKLIEKLKSQKN
jgi:hypothetical protein